MKPYNTKAFLFTAIISMTFLSCSNSKNEIGAFKLLDESLVISNKNFERLTDWTYMSLQNKLNEPSQAFRAKIWFSKAEEIEKLSKDMIAQIEITKSEIEKENGLTTAKANQLYTSLTTCKRNLLGVDPSIKKTFGDNMVIISGSFDSLTQNKNDFIKTFFNDIPIEAEKAMLDKFVNNIQISKNKLITFCNEQVPRTDFVFYNEYAAIVTTSSSYVAPKEKIEITAGIGGFLTECSPEVKINNKKVMLDVTQGYAQKEISASEKPGKHFIPVEINYIDQNGHKQTVSKRLEYTVADCPTKEN